MPNFVSKDLTVQEQFLQERRTEKDGRRKTDGGRTDTMKIHAPSAPQDPVTVVNYSVGISVTNISNTGSKYFHEIQQDKPHPTWSCEITKGTHQDNPNVFTCRPTLRLLIQPRLFDQKPKKVYVDLGDNKIYQHNRNGVTEPPVC